MLANGGTGSRIIMTNLSKKVGLLFIVMAALCGVSSAQESIPFPEALNKAAVNLSSMTNASENSLMLGNGDLYGIVWEKENNLFMRITKNDIWDARVNTSGDGPMPKVDIPSGEITGTVRAGPSTKNYLYPQPRCATALRLGPVDPEVKAHLDLHKAVASIASGSNKTQVRILHDRNVILVMSPHPIVIEPIKAETLPDPTTGTTDGINWLMMNMPGDVDYKGMDYAVAVASRGNLKAVAVVTSFDIGSRDVLNTAIALAKDTIAQDESKLLSTHEQGWENYWSRSGVELQDPDMQNWWYRILYFAQTVCRPGAAPVGLMPPLATDNTPWHADFHHNYNAWQAF